MAHWRALDTKPSLLLRPWMVSARSQNDCGSSAIAVAENIFSVVNSDRSLSVPSFLFLILRLSFSLAYSHHLPKPFIIPAIKHSTYRFTFG